MKIVVMGPKGAGKSTVGLALAELLGLQAVETDTLTEDLHEERTGRRNGAARSMPSTVRPISANWSARRRCVPRTWTGV